MDKDGWTVRTRDGSASAHFEYTVALEPQGAVILGTGAVSGGRAAPERRRGALAAGVTS